MKSVDEALNIILGSAEPLEAEAVPLEEIEGRVAAEDHLATITQPPFSASAMDGYAVRFEDCIAPGRTLRVIGEAPAGAPFSGQVESGTAVRVFTGAVMPKDADHVIIQEDVVRNGNVITVTRAQASPRHIRQAGIDFSKGDLLAKAGTRFGPFHGTLLAAANLAYAKCYRRPRVALFSNGDELRPPGTALAPGEIVDSNHYAISAITRAAGGVPTYLGCAPDNPAAITEMYQQAAEADIIVPIGGASVGEYDFMRDGFLAAGGKQVFEKIAVKPGKPTWFGRLGTARVVGLPGNPASAMVTACLFVQPLIARLAGEMAQVNEINAVTAHDLPANGPRETYLRAERIGFDGGHPVVQAFHSQDSSLISAFTRCDILIRRAPNAGAVSAGDVVKVRLIRADRTRDASEESF